MRTAVFEFGKQSLAEWIDNNRDCEKMILKGKVFCNLHDDNFTRKIKENVYKHCWEVNIGWHSFDLLFGFEEIAKDFRPIEFDISEMHLVDYYGEISDEYLFEDAYNKRPSQIFKMLSNRKYGTRYIYNNGFLTTLDKKVLIHCDKITNIVNVPEGIEMIGRIAFATIDEITYKVILPDGIIKIDESAFAFSYGLTQINFPDSLQSLGEYAFCGTELSTVLLPDSIEEIPEGCFQFVYIDELHLPSNLKHIRYAAFVGLCCEEVRLPQGIEIVEGWSLSGHYEKIYIPKSIKILENDFYYEDGIEVEPEERKPIIEEY